jgi:cytoskeletal protein RodZ
MLARHVPLFPQNLAEYRSRKGISLAQVGDATKISLRYLEAIEWGDFGKLPGGVYGFSYVRQYARAVDCDENLLVACYREVATPVEESSAASRVQEPQTRRFRDRILSLLASAGPTMPVPR